MVDGVTGYPSQLVLIHVEVVLRQDGATVTILDQATMAVIVLVRYDLIILYFDNQTIDASDIKITQFKLLCQNCECY